MISLYDDDGHRLTIGYDSIDFNDPDADPDDGIFTDHVAFSTPVNFQSEVQPDISKQLGGIELYNPRVASRVLTLRARAMARTQGALFDRLSGVQEVFSPAKRAYWHAKNAAGSLVWPPIGGEPSFIDDFPLTCTRMTDGSRDAAFLVAFTNGKMLLQYYVAPLELPDPIISAVSTGYGASLSPSFLVMRAGMAFARSESSLSGNGNVVPAWGHGAMFPRFTFSMTGGGAGSATLTITTSANGHHATALVLDASSLTGTQAVIVDTRTRTIKVNGVLTPGLYASGNWPTLRGLSTSTNTIAWTNTTNTTSRTTYYRECDWF